MKYGDYYVSKCYDSGIEREDSNGNPQICEGYYCQVYSDEEMECQVDDFCLAVGHEIPDISDESLERGIRWYLGIDMEHPMAGKIGSDQEPIFKEQKSHNYQRKEAVPMISISLEHNGKYTELDFPCREKDLQTAMDLIGAEPNRIHCMAIYDVLDPVDLMWLENRIVDLDELNFLAKRLEHMTPDELPEFFAAVKCEGKHNLSDLINLTYNLHCYTVIRDMTDLRTVGRKYMSAVKPDMTPQEWGAMDFASVGRKLINSGKGVITEYGVVFKNEGIDHVVMYAGTTFPAFDYKGDSLLSVSLHYGDLQETVYLPTEALALNKAALRLGAPALSQCETHLLDFSVDNAAWRERFKSMLKQDGLVAANFVANAINVCDVNLDKLFAVMKYAGVDSPTDITKLIDRMGCFTFVPTAKDYEDVGHYVMDCMAEYALHPSYAPYFDYKAFGKDFAQKYDAQIVPGGIVFLDGSMTLDEILEREPKQSIQMGAMEM